VQVSHDASFSSGGGTSADGISSVEYDVAMFGLDRNSRMDIVHDAIQRQAC